MFYYLSKSLWFLLQPSSIIALILFLGLVLSFSRRGQQAGRWVMVAGWCGLLIGGLSPLANILILPLENQVARADLASRGPISGIIVLGGSEIGRVAVARGAIALNEAGERILETAVLARRYPQAKILISGGAAQFIREAKSGAPSIAEFLVNAGIAKSRIIYEETSRNTFENAVYSKALIKPKANENWVLITSAFHMSRALGCYRKVGFAVLPWPVDYRTKGRDDLLRPFDSIGAGLRRLDLAAKEWIGTFAYYLVGRTGTLFTQG